MTKTKITMREAIFYRLYKKFKAKDESYTPVFECMGEIYCPEVGKWGFVSYEVSARASSMIKENPGLLERTSMRGKSGATYYGYRISPLAKRETILDAGLLAFYDALKKGAEKARQKPKCSDPELTRHCSGCTDSRSEGTHAGCTVEHGHVGCDKS